MLSEIFISAPAFPQFPCYWFGKQKPNPALPLPLPWFGPIFWGGEYYATPWFANHDYENPSHSKRGIPLDSQTLNGCFFFPGGEKKTRWWGHPEVFFSTFLRGFGWMRTNPHIFFPSKWSSPVFFSPPSINVEIYFFSPKKHTFANLQVHVEHDGQFNLQWVDSFLWCVGG